MTQLEGIQEEERRTYDGGKNGKKEKKQKK